MARVTSRVSLEFASVTPIARMRAIGVTLGNLWDTQGASA
jgi:hypothetical protein